MSAASMGAIEELRASEWFSAIEALVAEHRREGETFEAGFRRAFLTRKGAVLVNALVLALRFERTGELPEPRRAPDEGGW